MAEDSKPNGDELMETISAGVSPPTRRSTIARLDPLVVSVVTQRDIPPAGLFINTPNNMQNYVLAAVTPIMAILTRSAKTYVNTLAGLITVAYATMGTEAQFVAPGPFWHTLQHCAGIAVAPAVISLITNAGLLLSKLDQKFPALQA